MTNEHWDKVHARAEKFFADNDKEMNGLDDIQKATNFAIAEMASAVPAGPRPTISDEDYLRWRVRIAAAVMNPADYRDREERDRVGKVLEKELREFVRLSQFFAPSPATGQPPRCKNCSKEIKPCPNCADDPKCLGFLHLDGYHYCGATPSSMMAERAAVPAPESPLQESSRTYGELPGAICNMIEPHEWDNKNISEQRDYALDMVDFLERELGNFRRNQAAAKPAEPVALEEVARERDANVRQLRTVAEDWVKAEAEINKLRSEIEAITQDAEEWEAEASRRGMKIVELENELAILSRAGAEEPKGAEQQ